jgi:hypothetical protein
MHYDDMNIARHPQCDGLKSQFIKQLMIFLTEIGVLMEHKKIGPFESIDVSSTYWQQSDKLGRAADITLQKATPMDVLWANGVSFHSLTKARTQMKVGKMKPRYDAVQVKEWCENEKRMKKDEDRPPKFVRCAAFQDGKGKTHPMPRPEQVFALAGEAVQFGFQNVERISSIELDPSWAKLSSDTTLSKSPITGYSYAVDEPNKICEKRGNDIWHIGHRTVARGEYTFEMTVLFSNLLEMTVKSDRAVAKQNSIPDQFCPKECITMTTTKQVTKKRGNNDSGGRMNKKAKRSSVEKTFDATSKSLSSGSNAPPPCVPQRPLSNSDGSIEIASFTEEDINELASLLDQSDDPNTPPCLDWQ